MDLSDLRKQYQLHRMDKETLAKTPHEQFSLWWDEALKAEMIEPNAFCLATADAQGRPSCRMVLMKAFDPEGLTFFTNLESLKAQDISANPQVAATFWWGELERQIRIQGRAKPVSEALAQAYFARRPHKSQLSAWASRQDTVLRDRHELEEAVRKVETRFANQELPLPPFWGGFKIIPESFEFWQGRENRLHDRFLYRKGKGNWIIEYLSP